MTSRLARLQNAQAHKKSWNPLDEVLYHIFLFPSFVSEPIIHRGVSRPLLDNRRHTPYSGVCGNVHG